jgi:hypothetical protein
MFERQTLAAACQIACLTAQRANDGGAGPNDVSFLDNRRVDAPVLVGRTVEDAINFQLAIGLAGEVFREAGAEAETKRAQIEAALAAAINAQKV